MKYKMLNSYIVINIVILILLIVNILAGGFNEETDVEYYNQENGNWLELNNTQKVDISFNNTFIEVDNIIFIFKGCAEQSKGIVKVSIYDEENCYYSYDIPIVAIEEDTFYLYTNEIHGLEKNKKYDIAIEAEDLGETPIYLYYIEQDYINIRSATMGEQQLSWIYPVIGIRGTVKQMGERLSNSLLLWGFMNLVYIVVWVLGKIVGAIVQKGNLSVRPAHAAIILACLILTIFYGVYHRGELQETKVIDLWTANPVNEFAYIPLYQNEVEQSFWAQGEFLESFILFFDHYDQEDNATVTVRLTDGEGKNYYDWDVRISDITSEVYCLIATIEQKLTKGNEYVIHLSVDGEETGITVRAIKEGDIDTSLNSLHINKKEETAALYLNQKYIQHSSYVAIWGAILGGTIICWGIGNFCDIRVKRFLKIGFAALLPVFSYLNLEIPGGNIAGISIGYTIINLLIIAGIYLILRVLMSEKIAAVISLVLSFAVGLINYYVVQFRGTEFQIADIRSFKTAASVMENYEFTFPPRLYTCALMSFCLVFLYITLIPCSDERTGIKVLKKIGLLTLGVSMLIVVLLRFAEKDQKELYFFTLSNNFAEYGWCYTNVLLLKSAQIEKPGGYSEERIQSIAEVSATYEKNNNNEVIPENLIIIMNESFSDLSVIGELETNQDYIPYIRRLNHNTVKGNLHVSTFGGNTSITEYEFLTGNTQHFLTAGSVPYSSVCQEEESGLCKILKEQNFYSVAMHPYGATNWNRDKVYSAMGFDEFIDLDGYKDAEKLRDYVTDQGNYQTIIDYYENFDKNKNLFIFNVTMQNHGGYDVDNGVIENSIEILNFDSAVGETYLSLINESDQAFASLLSYFTDVKEPTMIVMFGDHQPALSTDFYANLYGKDLDERSSEELSKQYITPYIIWTNYDSDFTQAEDISANYLASYILECAGLQMSEYNHFLLQLREEIPVIGMYGIYKDMQYYSYREINKEILEDYEILQYLRIKDRNSSLYNSIFSCIIQQ